MSWSFLLLTAWDWTGMHLNKTEVHCAFNVTRREKKFTTNVTILFSVSNICVSTCPSLACRSLVDCHSYHSQPKIHFAGLLRNVAHITAHLKDSCSRSLMECCSHRCLPNRFKSKLLEEGQSHHSPPNRFMKQVSYRMLLSLRPNQQIHVAGLLKNVTLITALQIHAARSLVECHGVMVPIRDSTVIRMSECSDCNQAGSVNVKPWLVPVNFGWECLHYFYRYLNH